MRKVRALSVICLFLLAAVAAFAADVTGKWTAQVPGRGGQTREMTFNLKADGANLTGTITTQRGDADIADGKIDGDQISFSQTMDFGGNSVKLIYKGKVSGDTIEFTREREGGDAPPATFTAKRAS